MVTIPSLTVRVEGLNEVIGGYKALSRSLQTKLGIQQKKSAENVKKHIQQLMFEWNINDSWNASDSLEAIQIAPFVWEVGDFNYPEGARPHLNLIEYGFQGHWIHRSMINPNSIKMQGFLASGKQFVWVGPMYPRPVRFYGSQYASVENFPNEQKAVEEAIAEAFIYTLK